MASRLRCYTSTCISFQAKFVKTAGHIRYYVIQVRVIFVNMIFSRFNFKLQNIHLRQMSFSFKQKRIQIGQHFNQFGNTHPAFKFVTRASLLKKLYLLGLLYRIKLLANSGFLFRFQHIFAQIAVK